MNKEELRMGALVLDTSRRFVALLSAYSLSAARQGIFAHSGNVGGVTGDSAKIPFQYKACSEPFSS
jgi:hypothetical protein